MFVSLPADKSTCPDAKTKVNVLELGLRESDPPDRTARGLYDYAISKPIRKTANRGLRMQFADWKSFTLTLFWTATAHGQLLSEYGLATAWAAVS